MTFLEPSRRKVRQGGANPECSGKQGNSDNGDLEDEPPETSEEPSDTAQNMPDTVSKLYDSFTGKPHPSAQSPTRSCRPIDHDDSNIAFYRTIYYGMIPPRLMCAASDTTGRFDQPNEYVRRWGLESVTMRKAEASSERSYLNSSTKRGMNGQIDRPKRKTVLGTRIGITEKYSCRLVAQGFRQVKGYTLRGLVLLDLSEGEYQDGTQGISFLDWKARHLDVDMVYLDVNVNGATNIELSGGYDDFKNQVGQFKKPMYGLVHAALLSSKQFRLELKAKGFERSQADTSVFRRVLCGKVVVFILVLYVDELLAATTTKRDENKALK